MSDSDRPSAAPDSDEGIIDAEFEEEGGTSEQAMVLAQEVAQRLVALGDRLEGIVPADVQADINLLGEFALATAQRQQELEARFDQMQTAQEARNKALATILAGGELPLTTATAEEAEKVPEKLRPLEIETPDSVELVDEKFTITLTNPNGEEVEADVSVTLQNFDGEEDPVLECVVNPREGRSSGLTQRSITLGPNDCRKIEVAIRSKLRKNDDKCPWIKDIIAEQLTVKVTLTPTDVDSDLDTRKFPPIQHDVSLKDTLTKKESELVASDSSYLQIEGIEFAMRHSDSDSIRQRSDSIYRYHKENPERLRNGKITLITKKGGIPLRLILE